MTADHLDFPEDLEYVDSTAKSENVESREHPVFQVRRISIGFASGFILILTKENNIRHGW